MKYLWHILRYGRPSRKSVLFVRSSFGALILTLHSNSSALRYEDLMLLFVVKLNYLLLLGQHKTSEDATRGCGKLQPVMQ